MPRIVANERFAATPDFRLSDASAQTQSAPVFAALPGGGFVAIWWDDMVRGQFFDRNGRELGTEFTVGEGNVASIAALPSGGFVVTWLEARPYPSNEDVVARIFDAAGAPVGAELDVNSVTEARQESPMVAALAGGGFVVTWVTPFGQGFDNIRAQVFAADGSKIGGEIVANDSVQGTKDEPDIIALADGGFLIAWSQPGVDADFSPGSRAQLFDAAGTKVGAAFSLNPSLPGSQVGPDLAALPGGGFVAAWSDDGNPFTPDPHPENKGIWLQIFDAAGIKVGAAVHVSTLGPIGQGTPEVEIIPGTGIIVTWVDGNTTAENGAGHLRAQMFDFAGNKTGEEFAIDPGGTGQLQVDLTVLTTGAFVVGWTQRVPPQFSDEDVRAQLFFPTLSGTEGNDSFAGTADRDFYLGRGGDDQLSGGAEEDGLVGGNGNDTLDGGTGNDDLAGGAGNDTYFVDSSGDIVSEAVGDGRDVVYSTVDYVLIAGQEVEVLSAASHAATTPLNLTGNALGQEIWGNAGANNLRGGGGTDYLVGQGGNDTYFVDTAAALVFENAGAGNDVVYASVSYTLLAGQSVEVLSAGNHAATTALSLTGNELGQEVWGNAGANNLRGGGGTDYLVGQGGDDTYFVDTASALVFENAGNGRDVVYTSVNYTLLAGQSVEVLSAGNHAATTPLSLTGNELGQEVWGNAGANNLRGGGGTDYLLGQGGNDTYFVDVAAVQVYETAGAGNDIVYASVSYALLGGQSVEVLSTSNHAATTALDMTGNELIQELWGNAGANVLDGKLGNDALIGQSGADTFAFTTALGANNVDFVADFVAGTDRIALDDAIFTGLAPGALSASAFVIGTSAQDADDRIIYNSATGQLYFDADGNGAGAAIQFATLFQAPALTASDFTVI